MQIGNRLFPYPVVNRNKALSDFKDNACYKLAFGDPDYPIKDDRHDLVLQDIYIELVDDTLTTYVEKGLLQPMLVVESPESVFRQTYKLSLVPQTIYIPLNSLSGKVTVSSYLYATQNIADYRSLNFIEDFEGIDFDLNQYDIDECINKINNFLEYLNHANIITIISCDFEERVPALNRYKP